LSLWARIYPNLYCFGRLEIYQLISSKVRVTSSLLTFIKTNNCLLNHYRTPIKSFDLLIFSKTLLWIRYLCSVCVYYLIEFSRKSYERCHYPHFPRRKLSLWKIIRSRLCLASIIEETELESPSDWPNHVIGLFFNCRIGIYNVYLVT
jgi:hypothetical protein